MKDRLIFLFVVKIFIYNKDVTCIAFFWLRVLCTKRGQLTPAETHHVSKCETRGDQLTYQNWREPDSHASDHAHILLYGTSVDRRAPLLVRLLAGFFLFSAATHRVPLVEHLLPPVRSSDSATAELKQRYRLHDYQTKNLRFSGCGWSSWRRRCPVSGTAAGRPSRCRCRRRSWRRWSSPALWPPSRFARWRASARRRRTGKTAVGGVNACGGTYVSQDAGFALEEGPDAPAGQSQAQDADPYGETADGEVGEALHSLVLVHLEDGAEGEQDRAAELQIGEYHWRKDEGGLTATTTFRVRKTRYFVTSETPIFDATGETCDEVPGDNCDLWWHFVWRYQGHRVAQERQISERVFLSYAFSQDHASSVSMWTSTFIGDSHRYRLFNQPTLVIKQLVTGCKTLSQIEKVSMKRGFDFW